MVRVDIFFLLLILKKAFGFSLMSMLAVVLFCMAFIMLRCIPSIPTLLTVFIINGCSLLSHAFYASVEMIMWFLFFILLICCITWVVLWMLNVCIPGINPIWSWCLILSVYYWIWFVNTLLRNFATICIRATGLYFFFLVVPFSGFAIRVMLTS